MDLSIVILHHGRPKDVTDSLSALKDAWLPKEVEVFVINNGRRGANADIPFSNDGSIGPNLPFELKFFEIANKGYPQGNNHGISMTKGKYVCILTDIVIEKNSFKVMMNYMNTHPKVGIVAPRLVFKNGEVQDNYRVFPRAIDLIVKRTVLKRFFPKRMRRYLMWDKDDQVSEPVDWLTGAVQLFSRKCWTAIGPKDERYFLFMSDVDICRTAWDKGFEVHFVGGTEAIHDEARLSGGGVMDVFKKKVVRIHILDSIKYYLKYLGKAFPKHSPSGRG